MQQPWAMPPRRKRTAGDILQTPWNEVAFVSSTTGRTFACFFGLMMAAEDETRKRNKNIYGVFCNDVS